MEVLKVEGTIPPWGSENRTFKIPKHLKYGLFEGWISNGSVLKWWGFSYGYSDFPGFQMFFDQMAAICLISNGWASGFQIPFKIQTICNPTSFRPFEIQISPDLRSPRYFTRIYYCIRAFTESIGLFRENVKSIILCYFTSCLLELRTLNCAVDF